MRVIGYVRVSQVAGRKGASFISPDVQREQIERWATANDAQVVQVLVELDESGGRRDRPLLERCVGAVESGEVDGLVVAKLDRYSRDQLAGHQTLARIRDASGFLVIAGEGGLDTREDNGKMLFGFLLTIAEGQLDRYRAQFSDARERAVMGRGIHPCPVPPFGYTRDEDDKGHALGPLYPDAAKAGLLREMFVRRAAGEGPADVARWLESEGATSAYGASGWTGRAVKAITRNRVYLGEARHGEFVNPGAHEPLVDDLTWRRAQRPGIVPASRSDRPALLAGILRCAGCRYGMKSYINSHGKREYACHRRHASGRCPEPSSSSDGRLEEVVVEEFFRAVGDVAVRSVEDTARYDEARRMLAQAEADLVSYRDSHDLLRELGAVGFAEGVPHYRRRVEEAEAAVDAAAPASVAELNVTRLQEGWEELEVREQRQLLGLAIDCVFLRRGNRNVPIADRIHVCLRGHAPALPKIGSHAGSLPPPFLFPVGRPGDAVASGEHAPEGDGNLVSG